MITLGFPGSTVIKNQLASAEDTRDWVSIPGLGRFPKEGSPLATHSSSLAWKTPRAEEPGGPHPWDPEEQDKMVHAQHALNSN